jgi:dienelactone hydrolase
MKSIALLGLILFFFSMLMPPSGDAAPGLKDTRGWQRQHIQFYKKWRHGKVVKFRSLAKDNAQISGLLYQPKGEGPFPAIVLLHGRGGVFPYQENWAYILSQHGYVTLMVDGYCNRGLRCLRLGKIRKTRAWKKMRETDFRIGDAQGGFAYLAGLDFVDKNRIGGFGFSRGGSALIDSVVRAPRSPLKALVALYPQDIRSITHNVGWSVPTIIAVPTAKHKSRKITYSRDSKRASFPRDGFEVELLSLPNTTIKYDQPGQEIISPLGTRFHRKFNKEATGETRTRAIRLFHEHLGGSLEPAE